MPASANITVFGHRPMAWCGGGAPPVPVPLVPDSGGATVGTGARVRVCTGGVQRCPRHAGACTPRRTALCHGRGTVQGPDRGEENSGTRLVGRGVVRRVAAGAGGSEHRVPQLLRLGHRETEGPRLGPPRFRSRRDHRQTIRFTKNAQFRITAAGKLRLPKIGGTFRSAGRGTCRRIRRR